MALRELAGWAIEFKCHGGFQNFSSTTILKILKFYVKTTLEGDRLSRAPRLSTASAPEYRLQLYIYKIF